ncbi:hypothetical protein ACROYT_G010790 [Oculina patagonica]
MFNRKNYILYAVVCSLSTLSNTDCGIKKLSESKEVKKCFKPSWATRRPKPGAEKSAEHDTRPEGKQPRQEKETTQKKVTDKRMGPSDDTPESTMGKQMSNGGRKESHEREVRRPPTRR